MVYAYITNWLYESQYIIILGLQRSYYFAMYKFLALGNKASIARF